MTPIRYTPILAQGMGSSVVSQSMRKMQKALTDLEQAVSKTENAEALNALERFKEVI
jgi:hypothetical protein